ncbi:putative transferase [Helianthus annuus]|nr:putative transferase [Helianthus annuus]KAJ0929458.1 putative transferase [Helianthus annuus]
MFPENKLEVPADYQSPSQSMNEFSFDTLNKATREFCPDLLLGVGRFRKVFLGWVDKKTFAPSKHGDGIAIVVKRFNQENCQGYAEWLVSTIKCT